MPARTPLGFPRSSYPILHHVHPRPLCCLSPPGRCPLSRSTLPFNAWGVQAPAVRIQEQGRVRYQARRLHALGLHPAFRRCRLPAEQVRCIITAPALTHIIDLMCILMPNRIGFRLYYL